MNASLKQFIPVLLICTLCAACRTPAPHPPDPQAQPGRKAAYILSASLTAHTLTVDPMQFLTGPAAMKTYQRDNPGETAGPPDDYYIVNPKKERVVLPFAKDAVVKLAGGSTGSQMGTVPQAKLVGYRGLGNQPFWLTILDGKVTKVEEQFTP